MIGPPLNMIGSPLKREREGKGERGGAGYILSPSRAVVFFLLRHEAVKNSGATDTHYDHQITTSLSHGSPWWPCRFLPAPCALPSNCDVTTSLSLGPAGEPIPPTISLLVPLPWPWPSLCTGHLLPLPLLPLPLLHLPLLLPLPSSRSSSASRHACSPDRGPTSQGKQERASEAVVLGPPSQCLDWPSSWGTPTQMSERALRN